MNRQLLFFALLWPIFLFGCKGKSPTDSSGNDKRSGVPAGSTLELPMPVEGSKDQAVEVFGVSKPVKLSLALHRTKIKLGESLWYQLQIQNVGTPEIRFSEDFFHDPWALGDNFYSRVGVYFLIHDRDGELLQKRFYIGTRPDAVGIKPSEDPPDPLFQEQVNAKITAWRKDGLSDEEVNLKLLDMPRPIKGFRLYRLGKGEFVKTAPWVFQDRAARDWKPRKPIGDFAELWMFKFDKKGSYRIRAVFNSLIGITSEGNHKEDQKTRKDVFVETPDIVFEVVD